MSRSPGIVGSTECDSSEHNSILDDPPQVARTLAELADPGGEPNLAVDTVVFANAEPVFVKTWTPFAVRCEPGVVAVHGRMNEAEHPIQISRTQSCWCGDRAAAGAS